MAILPARAVRPVSVTAILGMVLMLPESRVTFGLSAVHGNSTILRGRLVVAHLPLCSLEKTECGYFDSGNGT